MRWEELRHGHPNGLTDLGLKEILLPQDRGFYDLFEKLSHNNVIAANELYELISNYEKVDEMHGKIKDVEHSSDMLVHQIYEQTAKTFITPLDRHDIGRLASSLDGVIDLIYAIALRMHLYGVEKPTESMLQLSKILIRMTGELDEAVRNINRLAKKKDELMGRLVELHKLENTADQLLNTAVAGLFKEGDAVRIIKYKELYEKLEEATDRCEDAADVIRDLLMEYA